MDRKEIEMLKRSSDEAFKELMHDRDVLAWTALAVIDEFRNMKPEQVKSMMCDDGDRAMGLSEEPNISGAGRIVMDNVFGFRFPNGKRIGLILNVEAQNRRRPGYPLNLRAMYYVTRLFSMQGKKDGYGSLSRVYSVWIMPRSSGNGRERIRSYSLRENGNPRHPMLRYGDRMKLVIVNLPYKYTEREDPQSFLTLMFSDRDLSDEQVRAALAQNYNIAAEALFTWRGKLMNSLADDVEDYYTWVGEVKGRAEGISEGKIEVVRDYIVSQSPGTIEEVIQMIGMFNLSEDLRNKALKDILAELDLSS